VPGRLEAERPRHHAEVPPHEGEPALGVRCRGTRGVGDGTRARHPAATLDLGVILIIIVIIRIIIIILWLWLYHRELGDVVCQWRLLPRAQARERKIIQLTTRF